MMRFLALVLAALSLGACTPLMIQQAGQPPLGFSGPRIEASDIISFDGAKLGLSEWDAVGGEPWAVVVGVHGMNDYANAFHMAAPWWAEQGITTIAYDQRGFGRSPGRGVWAGEDLMVEDLRTVAALARARYPHAVLVAAKAFASERPPTADRLVLLSPAVWGWRAQPLPNKTLLWLAANFTGSKVYEPPRWLTSRVSPTDNRAELMAMGRDPLMIWGARSDTLYGLVSAMDKAADEVGKASLPTLYLYGAHDQIIPKAAAFKAAAGLKPTDRSAYYAGGWHLMMRDKEGPMVWKDILAFIRDPQAPLPSGAPGIPTAPTASGAGPVQAPAGKPAGS